MQDKTPITLANVDLWDEATRTLLATQLTSLAEQWNELVKIYRHLWETLQQYVIAAAPCSTPKTTKELTDVLVAIGKAKPTAIVHKILTEARITQRLVPITWAHDGHARSVCHAWQYVAERLQILQWCVPTAETATGEVPCCWDEHGHRVIGDLPSPSCLLASIAEEIAAAQLALALVRHASISPTITSPSAVVTATALNIQDWEELVIARTEDGQVWAFYPAPKLNTRVVLAKGHLVDCRGRHWQELVRALAAARDGHTVSLLDVWASFYGGANAQRPLVLTSVEMTKLRNTATEISKQLRKALQIQASVRQAPIRIHQKEQCLYARFLTRSMVIEGQHYGRISNVPTSPPNDPTLGL